MTSELSAFAARVRDFIKSTAARGGPGSASPAENEASFSSLAVELFTLQFTHNAAYRTICEKRRVKPPVINDWHDIPVVPAAAFKDLDLTSLPPEQRTHVFYSSGTTTQRPSRHFHCHESLALYRPSLLLWFRVHVEQRGQLAILAPAPQEAPHSSLAYMFDVIRRDSDAPESAFAGHVANDGTWAVDSALAVSRVKAACDSATRLVVLGTALTLVHLLDYLVERNLRFNLPKDSRVFETGGYKGRARSLPKREFYRLIRERLGVPRSRILSEYGMSELSSQAYDSVISADISKPSRRLSFARFFQFPPWAHAQIISPETGNEVADGETGSLRVYDLANVFSVMAIQTEDLGVRRGEGFELIGRAVAAEPRGCSLMSTDPQLATRNS